MGVMRTQASTIDTSGVSGPEVFHAGLDDSVGSLDLPMGQAERVSASLGIPTLGRTVAVFEKEATTWLGISGESSQGLDLEKLALVRNPAAWSLNPTSPISLVGQKTQN